MANQPLARRPATGDLMPQGRPGSPAQATAAQLAAMQDVTLTCCAGWDDTYGKVQAFLAHPGRDALHQQRLEHFAAGLFTEFTQSVAAIHRRALAEIVNPPEPHALPAPRIIEVPQKGLFPRLFGR
jgi:hypothetical protein